MAELPKLPLWTDAYLGDTGHLTTIEHGAYILLLITAWRSKDGTLPDDDKMLARYTRMTLDKWRKIRPIIEEFFTIENGVWQQGRLQDERKAALQFQNRQIEKGKAGAKARHLKNNDSALAQAKSGVATAQASPVPVPKVDTNVSTGAGDDFVLPDWIPQDLWSEHQAIRKKLKAQNTPTANKLLVKKLEKFSMANHDIVAIMEASIENSWKSFFEPKTKGSAGHGGQSSQQDRLKAAIMRGFDS